MDEAKPNRKSARSYTLAALLGLFVMAVLVALAGRLLPGGISRFARRARRGGDGQDSTEV
jgi:hypothetical protein